jgi:Predicted membrane protein
MITVLFACIFKFLPDVKVKWKYVWFGAFITSGLFYIGKYLITTYLQYATFSSTYGAAGSLVVFLVWINYSSLILFFGAELTQVTRKYYSKTELEPKNGFVKIKKVSTLVADSVEKLKNSNNDK